MILPTERRVHDFNHAVVIYTSEISPATGRRMPKLYVQAFDAYRYQRELAVQFTHQPGNSSVTRWEYVAYQHPGRRHEGTISSNVAERFILRFLSMVDDYPTLLFNNPGEPREGYAQHDGFVHMMERLHRGQPLGVRVLP